VSANTVANVAKAIKTMKRISEEKVIRAQEKAKRKARSKARKATFANRIFSSITSEKVSKAMEEATLGSERHVWEQLDKSYAFDSESME
jgi:hypothetical protein